MKYTIYKVTNKINGKVYIGKHMTNNPYDTYMGSGKAIKQAIKLYGKSSFIKEVLFIFETEKEMNDKEIELVNESFISTNKTYNIGLGGEGGAHFSGKKHSEESKKKLSEFRKGLKHSPETRKKISESNKRKEAPSQETKAKIAEKARLRWADPEKRQRHSEIMKNHYNK